MRVVTLVAFPLDDEWWEQFRESASMGIGYWASDWRYSPEGMSVTEEDCGETSAATWQQVADAAARLAKQHPMVMRAMLDPGDLDPDAADLIVQQACLLEVRYG